IRSGTAGAGDFIIAAYDMGGKVGPNSPYSFDSTTMKEPEAVREKYKVMEELGERKLVTAGKDISNPGLIGTLGMLLETSKKGARVDLEKIQALRLASIHNLHFIQSLVKGAREAILEDRFEEYKKKSLE
ncbi:MAG: AIR synthase-related protein, partial [Candidatus Methanoperedens sp.]|nr:AIR synthase-related protein [Candidatus Methanoperedens sp.]